VVGEEETLFANTALLLLKYHEIKGGLRFVASESLPLRAIRTRAAARSVELRPSCSCWKANEAEEAGSSKDRNEKQGKARTIPSVPSTTPRYKHTSLRPSRPRSKPRQFLLPRLKLLLLVQKVSPLRSDVRILERDELRRRVVSAGNEGFVEGGADGGGEGADVEVVDREGDVVDEALRRGGEGGSARGSGFRGRDRDAPSKRPERRKEEG
jgi:hypothetical protein